MKSIYITTFALLISLSSHSTFGSDMADPATCGCYPPEVLKAFQTIKDFNTQLPQTICTVEPKRFLDTVASGSSNQGSAALAQTLALSKVILAGEVHLYTDLASRLHLVKEFRKANGPNSCVAFEWPSQPAGLSETLRHLKAMESTDLKAGGKHLVRAENVRRMIDYYEPMGDLAKKLGMKAVTVDHKDRLEKDLSMDDRNSAMSSNIFKLLKSGSCTSILMFVGKSHISAASDSTTNLAELIRGTGTSVTSLNVQMTNESAIPSEARSFVDCVAPALKPNQYSFFPSSDLAGDPKLFPNMPTEAIKWKDFDFTLLVP